jgi:hypothetical protein
VSNRGAERSPRDGILITGAAIAVFAVEFGVAGVELVFERGERDV